MKTTIFNVCGNDRLLGYERPVWRTSHQIPNIMTVAFPGSLVLQQQVQLVVWNVLLRCDMRRPSGSTPRDTFRPIWAKLSRQATSLAICEDVVVPEPKLSCLRYVKRPGRHSKECTWVTRSL